MAEIRCAKVCRQRFSSLGDGCNMVRSRPTPLQRTAGGLVPDIYNQEIPKILQQAEPSVSTSSSVTLRTRAAYGLEMSKDGAMPRSRRFAAGMRIAVENFAHLLARERLQAALAECAVHGAAGLRREAELGADAGDFVG